ncbi:Formyltetrahydrofolate deformylase [Botrimarina colliarenosi]|uniref:Formyltetrahydrofolate deformylase n=1 Tax=Botrimarina colliarenosi TaxID=2528001 RepID=A0A5C6A7F6_9BACT|nr:formyltransferase family protein [Botrimarina colliarenosi]TWT95854.1 Formyltetrahydrofolate deformylase [Botrimarina colliarenosi]
MQAVITAVGPDHRGLADPIVHSVTELGANIAEIQMYDQDDAHVFSMLTRIDLDPTRYEEVRAAMARVAQSTGLSIRLWSPDLPSVEGRLPRLAVCVTFRPETPLAVLRAIRDGRLRGEATVVISNQKKLQGVAEQFGVPFRLIGDDSGEPNNDAMIDICDELAIDYIVLARYMRVLPAASCWKYAGGRIINLHHGLLPSFPGMRPYHEAYANRMLTYGATCHFIVPELDAGNQIINQATFSVPPGTSLEEVISRGQQDNEPGCLVEGVRRVVDNEVRLHFNRVVAAHSVG